MPRVTCKSPKGRAQQQAQENDRRMFPEELVGGGASSTRVAILGVELTVKVEHAVWKENSLWRNGTLK